MLDLVLALLVLLGQVLVLVLGEEAVLDIPICL